MQEILWVLGQHSDFLACISKSNRVKGPRVRVIMSSQAKLEIVRVFFFGQQFITRCSNAVHEIVRVSDPIKNKK